MTKFNLKEHIAKNKATFFGSLTEGQFSWMTQDTGQQIGSQDENTIPVYMFDDKGKYYYEKNYDGYGEFGGKDYYDLVAEMNGYTVDDAKELGGTFRELRGIGIKLAFDELEPKNGGPVLFPALVTKPDMFNYKTHDFTQEAKTDPNQSWYDASYEDNEDDDDEDYNRYGDEDEDEELEEGKKSKKYYKDAEADDAEHIEALEKDMKDDKKASKKIKKNTKMKVSEFKAKIKEMIVAEMNLDVTDETSGYNFLAELEGMMDEEDFSVELLVPTIYRNGETGELAKTPAVFGAKSELKNMDITNYSDGDELSEWVFDNDIEKAKYFEKKYPGLFKVEGMMSEAEKEEVEDEVDVDIESPEAMDEPTGGINVTQNADADLTGTEKELQDNLEAALEAAKKIGDDKLQQQIGNSLTFFTRQHVVKENIKETLLLQKRAGIITETQYKQKLNELDKPELSAFLKDKPDWLKDIYANKNNETSKKEVPLTDDVQFFIDKAIADSKEDGEFEELKKFDWFENELIDELIKLFPEEDYDRASKEVMDYILQAIN